MLSSIVETLSLSISKKGFLFLQLSSLSTLTQQRFVDSHKPEYESEWSPELEEANDLPLINMKLPTKAENFLKGWQSTDSSWKIFVEKPDEWVDYRKDKLERKVKKETGDFKHKDTGIALWLERAPNWALPKLEELGFHALEDNAVKEAVSIESIPESIGKRSDQLDLYQKNTLDGLVNPTYPTSTYKDSGEAIWTYESESVLSRHEESEFDPPKDATVKHMDSNENIWEKNLWKDLFESSSWWYDHRRDKLSGKASLKHPDFTHNESGQCLWLDSATPKWVLIKFKELENKDNIVSETETLETSLPDTSESSSQEPDLSICPSQCEDYQKDKLTWVRSKFSDVEHEDKWEKLWCETSLCKGLGIHEGRNSKVVFKESLWDDLVENPSMWVDFRKHKRIKLVKPRHPDFKHKDTGRSLWMEDSPKWVRTLKLDELEFHQPNR